ncbi:hybrid sensor histidine kinase/response regulator transcription factor [Ulvibacter antarcticus]|uniref:histidine kinase n=1 Tax=Ulvibacter antarcticus TaxID=442714 RepID=A0A3L9YDQ6_9FLAO|nr:response regulator [Ulvibacter antarcticus]RMA57169.1 phospho-acceptor domain-containing protein [Ulvibacter antarcticus]
MKKIALFFFFTASTVFGQNLQSLEGTLQNEKNHPQVELLLLQKKLEEQKSNNQRNLLLSALILASISGLFFYYQFRNRKKINAKLRELDMAKSTFFANISHEFRTPLTLIKGPLGDQLALEDLDIRARKNLLSAERNVIRLENLVEQLLALSKLESGHFQLRVEPGNLPAFTAVQAEAFSYSCHEKSINFTIHIEKDKATDWFDHDVIEKILFNLLANAVKFTPEKGSIIISGERLKSSFIFKVKNTGSTLKADQQKKLFERFYKSDDKSTGTGIGLALSKELAELHHGNITITNDAEGYLVFTTEIPVSKTSFDASEVFSEEVLKAAEEVDVPSEEKIENTQIPTDDAPIMLIVDDALDIRNYVSSIFETTYNVHTAVNGKEGFEKALTLIPDVIISDVMMPEDDGFTLTRNLKRHELTSHIPVILLTAKSDVTDKLEGMEIGADSYMTKPFSSQLVKATAENLIENRRKLQQRFSQEVILIPKEIAVTSADEQFLNRLQKVIDARITDPEFTVEEFSKEMSVSRMQLHRKLKALSGQSTSEFLRTQRLRLAIGLIKEGKISISEVGYTVGFNDPSYFTKCFKQEFGYPPSEFGSSK